MQQEINKTGVLSNETREKCKFALKVSICYNRRRQWTKRSKERGEDKMSREGDKMQEEDLI